MPADPDKSTFGGRVQTKASQRRVKTGLEAEARAGKSGLCLESCAVPAGARVTGQVRSRFPGETLQRPMMPPRPASPWCSAQGSCEALCLRLGIPFQTSGLLQCNLILQGIYSQPLDQCGSSNAHTMKVKREAASLESEQRAS